MQRSDWLTMAHDLRVQARQTEQLLRARQAEPEITAREYAALTDALRNAIGVQRALLRAIDCVAPAFEPLAQK